MSVKGASQTIAKEVLSWPGITAHPHRFGGEEYCVGERREIGHLHGDEVVDIPISIRLRDEWIAAGRAEPHHIFPELGAVTIHLRRSEDVARALELLRISYDLAMQQKARGQ